MHVGLLINDPEICHFIFVQCSAWLKLADLFLINDGNKGYLQSTFVRK